MSAKLIGAKDVQSHASAVSKWWADLSIEDLYFDGMAVDAQVAEAIVGWEAVRTITGPPTLKIDVHDPDRTLLTEVLPVSDATIIALADRTFTLAQVSKGTGSPTIGLTCEAEAAAWLKRYTKFRKVRRGTMTRAQFIYSMLKEVREGTIRAYIPDLRERQPVARAKASPGKRGVAKSDKLTVKGVPIKPDQIRVANEILDECVDLRAPYRAKVASIANAIQESTLKNLSGGDRDSVGVMQQRKLKGWAGDLTKVAVQTRNFLRRTPAGIDPFMTVLREHPSESIGWQIDQVQRSHTFGTSRQGAEHGQWVDEAKEIVAAYGESAAKSPDRKYEFSRGESGRRESSWAAALRLAEEVAWRFFIDDEIAFFINDDDLIAAAPATVFTESLPGVEIGFDYDFGKKVATASVTTTRVTPDLMPGLAVEIADCGAGDGIYIVETMSRRAGDLGETLDLIRPAPARSEPAGESTTKTGRGGAKETKSSGWVSPLKSMPAHSGRFGEPRPGHMHGGVDYPVGVGTPVRSVADGRVTHAGAEGAYGNSVVVSHANGYSTRYGHLSSVAVRSGQRVEAGDTIGRSGNTGRSTGPHLHFELMKNGQRICPASKVPDVSKSACARESI